MAFGSSAYGVGDDVVSGDSSAPGVVFTPPSGTTIGRNQAIQATVTDNVALLRVIVTAEYPSGAWDVVHDGVRFAGRYSGSEFTIVSAQEYRYTLRRQGGWSEQPTIRYDSIDTSGNQA